jgi:peroxiredoxin
MRSGVFLVLSLVIGLFSCEKDADTPIPFDKYIDLELPDTSGNLIRISDFDGTYRLIDFWASWCGPCRAENPNLVALFEKYQGHNFIIIGVSLDENEDAWKQAISDDNLTWPHMSDLNRWGSEAVDAYDLEYIPSNVLINPQGEIIARNKLGEELQQELEKLFGF